MNRRAILSLLLIISTVGGNEANSTEEYATIWDDYSYRKIVCCANRVSLLLIDITPEKLERCVNDESIWNGTFEFISFKAYQSLIPSVDRWKFSFEYLPELFARYRYNFLNGSVDLLGEC